MSMKPWFCNNNWCNKACDWGGSFPDPNPNGICMAYVSQTNPNKKKHVCGKKPHELAVGRRHAIFM